MNASAAASLERLPIAPELNFAPPRNPGSKSLNGLLDRGLALLEMRETKRQGLAHYLTETTKTLDHLCKALDDTDTTIDDLNHVIPTLLELEHRRAKKVLPILEMIRETRVKGKKGARFGASILFSLGQ